jgi:CO/xanthine dehydrogenase FAD-binding subunit
MRMPKFEYFAPKTLKQALKVLAEKGEGARVMAGGTDLILKMKNGLLKPQAIISLKEVEGLDRIAFKPGKGLSIGATALLADVAGHKTIQKRFPAVAAAAAETANVQIRNMGTVGGNLCNAAPSADNAPSLIAMGAGVTLAGLKGERRLPLDQFFTGPGQTAMEPGEIMTDLWVPLPPSNFGTSYQHVSARGKVDISAVCVGVMAGFDGEICQEVRICLGAVAPVPLRAMATEKLLQGQKWTAELIKAAGEQAAQEARPISDVRASAEYRREMVAVLTRRALKEAYCRAGKRVGKEEQS